ncbi:MAG: MraY family glycosyltransferase [Coprobacillus sp.]
MSLEIGLSFVVTCLISIIFVPIMSKISKKLGIIAQTNKRTIHTGIVARTGGYVIYASFLIGTMLFLKTDTQINSILIGGFIIFITGFYDDIHDISPKLKLAGQVTAALVVVFFGDISLKGFTLPFLSTDASYIFAIIITIVWIVGITNAVNLIDGLDGLCGGISIIVLITISLTSLTYGRTDIASLSLLLAGAIAGFLVYNFHPASIFLGDCGALFIGYMISVISLLGFGYKSSSFFTLGAPIVVLMIPIMDTLIAIIRRKVHHKSFSEADKNHLHHQLMFSLELGQTKSVLILYLVTILFSVCSYIYLYDKLVASILFIVLMIFFEIFVEATNMIDRKYKPLLTFMNIFIKSEYLPSVKDTKPYRKIAHKIKKRYVVIVLMIIGVGFGAYFMNKRNEAISKPTTNEIVYKEVSNQTSLMSNIYNQLKIAKSRNKDDQVREFVAAYFVADFYTLSNKQKGQIGGVDYFYTDMKDDFATYAKSGYYKNADEYILAKINNQEVVRYNILSQEKKSKALLGLEDYSYYDIEIEVTFKESNPIIASDKYKIVVTLIDKDNKFSVIAMEEEYE